MHKVVALAYDRLCTFEFGCTVELFALPRPELRVPWYEFAVCATERGPLRAAGGIEVRVRHPLRLLQPMYMQSIGIIQAPDIMDDGRTDMCDSCPDMTVYDGKLINSCRMDEYRLFGGMVTVVEKDKVKK